MFDNLIFISILYAQEIFSVLICGVILLLLPMTLCMGIAVYIQLMVTLRDSNVGKSLVTEISFTFVDSRRMEV